VFGGERETGGEAYYGEARGGGTLEVSPEGVDGGEHGAGGGHVGGDVGAVGEQVGIETEEGEGDESGADVEHLAGGEEDQ
jgi:hypothetical protein